MFICIINQHLRNIWSLIKHENFNQQWGWVEKIHCLLKSMCVCIYIYIYVYIYYNNKYFTLYIMYYMYYIYIIYTYYIYIYIIQIYYIYKYIYIYIYIYIYTQGIIQEFNLGVGSHVRITLWCELCSCGVWGKGGTVNPSSKTPSLFCSISLVHRLVKWNTFFLDNSF